MKAAWVPLCAGRFGEPDYQAGLYSLFPKEHAPDDRGMVAFWAWGVSRIIDYLKTDPYIDVPWLAVKGSSRMGRMAIWTGVFVQRVMLTIGNVTGKGGSSLLKRKFGLPASEVVGGEKNTVTSTISIDGRTVLMKCPSTFILTLHLSRRVCCTFLMRKRAQRQILAKPVYKRLGAKGLAAAGQQPGDVEYRVSHPSGPPEIYEYDRGCCLDFADKHLKWTRQAFR